MNAAPSMESFARLDTLSVRYGDLDADGLLAEPALARYIEQARSHALIVLLRECGIDLLDLDCAIGMLLAHTSVDILRHCAPGEQIQLATGVGRIGNSSAHLRVGIFSDGQCLALADNVLVFTARATGRPIPLPEALRERLQAAM